MLRTGKKIFTMCVLISLASVWGCGSLSQSVLDADMAAVQSRVQRGENVNEIDKWGWSPLLWAAYYNHYQISEYLLENGADPNLKSVRNQGPIPMGSTPLVVASYYGNAKITELLLKHGADKTIRNNEGNSAHDIARKYHFAPILELMGGDEKSSNP